MDLPPLAQLPLDASRAGAGAGAPAPTGLFSFPLSAGEKAAVVFMRYTQAMVGARRLKEEAAAKMHRRAAVRQHDTLLQELDKTGGEQKDPTFEEVLTVAVRLLLRDENATMKTLGKKLWKHLVVNVYV